MLENGSSTSPTGLSGISSGMVMAGAVLSSSVDADGTAQIELAIARLEVPARGRKELRRVGRVFTICMSRNNKRHGMGLSWGDSVGVAISKR